MIEVRQNARLAAPDLRLQNGRIPHGATIEDIHEFRRGSQSRHEKTGMIVTKIPFGIRLSGRDAQHRVEILAG